VLLLSTVVFISCSTNENNKEEESSVEIDKEDILISETLNLDVVLSEYGKARRIVKAPITQQYLGKDGKYTVFSAGIYIESYTDSLALESTIQAKFAKIMGEKDAFYSAYDSVVVTNLLQGTKIITDTLYWDAAKREIYNYCFTKFYLKGGDFNALNGFTADETLTYYEIRTIRDGSMAVERKAKSDSINTSPMAFPDTIIDIQTQQVQTQQQSQVSQQQPAQQKPRTISPNRNIERNPSEKRRRNLDMRETPMVKEKNLELKEIEPAK